MTDIIKNKKIHFLGAGGIGVSALAILAKGAGAVVSGCDRSENEMTEKLNKSGIKVSVGHSEDHLNDIDILVYTSAVKEDNKELANAIKSEIQVLKRGEFLAQLLLSYKKVIGICGTHGKTTTTWLTGSLLEKLGAEPTVILGGVPVAGKSNVVSGSKDLCVVELDESDGSFLKAAVDVGVITNIDTDHLDYYGSEGAVFKAFKKFAKNIRHEGELITCLDSNNANEIYKNHTGSKTGVRINSEADLCAEIISAQDFQQEFTIKGMAERFIFNIPGKHNINNLLCALAAVKTCGFNLEDCSAYVSELTAVERRFEVVGNIAGITLISDYAHHPVEVSETINTALKINGHRTVAVFQPHLYSRTKSFYKEFGQELAKADIVVLVEIYPAREKPMPGVDSNLIKNIVLEHNEKAYGPVPKNELTELLKDIVLKGDKVIFMGAGDIGGSPYEFMAELQR